MMTIRSAILGCLLIGLCRPTIALENGVVTAPGRYPETIVVDGLVRKFILIVPRSVDPKKAHPVVVVLHGYSPHPELVETTTEMVEEAEKGKFILAFPFGQGSPVGWNAEFIDLSKTGANDVNFVSQVLDQIEKQCAVDRRREYVCGHSNGAFLTAAVGSQLANRLAAIGMVAGTIGLPAYGVHASTRIANPVAPISVIAIHSRLDHTVSYDGSERAPLTGVSAPEASRWWASANGCEGQPIVKKSKDGLSETTLYRRGRDRTEVELITLSRGSHAWPGSPKDLADPNGSGFHAASALWSFFASHHRK